ncbi:MAG TPA: hypothetical protein VFR90_02790 [Methylibium sp.]|uniref:hypothetical protein n=1 Tax=Methylibium sp. TaxID=2067992 RepID=UPI002DC01F26|nr:hypothetical protein [Methylibium sp.]HEU4458030.1 hypothetical protein [Methylibium sp.]
MHGFASSEVFHFELNMPIARLLPSIVALSLAGCAGKPPAADAAATTSPTPSSTERAVKSRDGKFDGVVTGTPMPNSKFAKLQIGMSMSDVQNVLDRTPDRSHTYESGKRWIPFYFGNDARRMQVHYKGEGCLIFADGNIWGGAGGDLIRIDHDASGACYQP